MSSIRITDLEKTIVDEDLLQQGETYAIVDNGTNGTFKYNFFNLINQINDFKNRIEELERKYTDMDIDLPQQILNIDPATYFKHIELNDNDLTAKNFDNQGIYEYSTSTLNLNFYNESVIGINLTYQSLTATSAGIGYYINIVEKYKEDSPNAVETEKHPIDRIVINDKNVHQYSRWIKVHNGSQIIIQIFASNKQGSQVSTVLSLFAISILMYSKYPLITWNTDSKRLIKYAQNMSTSFIPTKDYKLFISGTMNYAGTYAYHSYGKMTCKPITKYRLSATTPEGISYYSTYSAGGVQPFVTILPTVEYAISAQSLCSTIKDANGCYLIEPKLNDTDQSIYLPRKTIGRNGQIYVLPFECPALSDIGPYIDGRTPQTKVSTYEYRWNSLSNQVLYTEILSANTVNYNADVMEIFQNDTNQYVTVVTRQEEDSRLLKKVCEAVKFTTTAAKYYELPLIDSTDIGKEYYVLYRYWAGRSQNQENVLTFNICENVPPPNENNI